MAVPVEAAFFVEKKSRGRTPCLPRAALFELGKHRGLPLRQNIALHAGECYEVYRVPSLPRAALFELGNHGGLPLLSLRTAESGVAISMMASL